MAKAHLKLATAEGVPPVDGVRQRLEEAQETLKAARIDLETLERAAQTARESRWVAQSVIDKIIGEATGDDGTFDSLMTALKSGDIPDSATALLQSSEENRLKVERTEREIEAWTKVEQTATARIPDQSDYVASSERRLDEAVIAVVRETVDVDPLLERAEALQLELIKYRSVLRYLASGNRLREDRKAAVSNYLVRAIDSFDNPAAQIWDRALLALKEDHAAPLPCLPPAPDAEI